MKSKFDEQQSKRDRVDEVTSAAPLSPDARGARTAGSGAEQGASPSNTAPNNSIDSNGVSDLPYFQALRWGVDSLYVSYKGKLSLEMTMTCLIFSDQINLG